MANLLATTLPKVTLTTENGPIICGPGGHFVISTDGNCSMVGATYSTRCFAFNGSCFKQTCELINSNCVQSPTLCATSCIASPILRATNTATIGATTAPPETFMVCGNSRFVRGGSPVTIYMGCNYQSVDVGFVWAACQDLQIKTYSGGWNQALRVLGTNTYACGCLQSPILCGTTCLQTNIIRNNTGTRYLNVYSGCNDSAAGGIYFRSCGGTSRGYVYFDGTSNFGLLNCSGQWAIRIVGNQSSNSCIYTCHPLEAHTCVQSPILCATTCVRAHNTVEAVNNAYFLSGPNGGWGCYLVIGGNGNNSSHATVATTNGNLHLDAKPSCSLYLNHYSSAGGIHSCGAFYNCTCFHTPRMCATTCLRSANVCATTATYSPILCATSTVRSNTYCSRGYMFSNMDYNSSSDRGPWNPSVSSIRGSGRRIYYDEDFHDGNNSVGVYNNSGGTAVTITRVDMSAEGTNCEAPNSSGQALRICWDGGSASPNRGGVIQTISSSRNKTFAQIFQACLPSGATLNINQNPQGTNSSSYWITNNVGTDRWEWYGRISHAGNSGTFGSGGHLSVSGPSSAFKWYIGSMTVYDVTDASSTCEDVIKAGCCVCSPYLQGGIICATNTSGYTLRTAGCIYSNSTIVAAGAVIATGTVCSTSCIQTPIVCATNYFAGNLIAGTGSTCTHGAITITGSKDGYGGIFSCGWTWMTNVGAAGVSGIYDSTGSQWGMYTRRSCETRLMYNGSDRLLTTTYGTCTVGVHCSSTAVCTPIVCATSCVKTNMLCSSNGSCIEFKANGELMIKGGGAYNTHLYTNGGGSHIVSTAQGGSVQFRNCTATNAWIYGCGRSCFNGNMCVATCIQSPIVCATSCVQAPYYRRVNHHTGHLRGHHDQASNSAKSNPIYTIGAGYDPVDAGLSNMYGIGYSNTAASFISGIHCCGGGGWGMYVAGDGDARIFLNSQVGGVGSACCMWVAPTLCATSYVRVGSTGTGVIKQNASYPTLELQGHGNELMIGAGGSDIHINYRATTTDTPNNWYWRAGSSTSYSNHNWGIGCGHTRLQSPIICATTCINSGNVGIGRVAGNFPLMLKGNTRYQLALCNSGAGDANYPWLVHTNDNFIIHFNAIADRFYFHNSGAFCAGACVCSPVVCASGTSGYTLKTAGCIYSNSTIVAAGGVVATGTVCSTSCVRTPVICATTCIQSPTHSSTSQKWSSLDMKCANFWVCSGDDSFKLDQGTGVLDIWVSDCSISHQPRSVFRAYNQGICIVLGQGCSANNNASIPVYACSCVQSPVVCATTSMCTHSVYATHALAINSNNTGILSFWGCHMNYSIGMSVYNTTGRGRLDGASDYNMYFRMTGGTNRGFVFQNSTTNIAQLEGSGAFCATSCVKSAMLCSTAIGKADTCLYSPIICAGTRVNTPIVCATNYMKVGAGSGAPTVCFFGSGSQVASIRHNPSTARLAIHDDGGNERFLVHTQAGSLQGVTCACNCLKSPVVCGVTRVESPVVCGNTIRANASNDCCGVYSGHLSLGYGSSYNTLCNMASGNQLHLRTTGNANIQINDSGSGKTYICNCVQSPVVCGTTAVCTDYLISHVCVKAPTVCASGTSGYAFRAAGCICATNTICGTTYIKVPIVCPTSCISLTSGSNVTKICNSVGFTVTDSTEGLLVRDNSVNVFSARGSGNCSLVALKACSSLTVTGSTTMNGCLTVFGSISKGSGCFRIPHPDPKKREKCDLVHSFVESPTEGDNIYRWQVDTSNCTSVITLPSYYRHLNKNDMVWVSPKNHFGSAYGEVTEDQKCLIICSQTDGGYNVLLIGTRKDDAVSSWSEPEIPAGPRQPGQNIKNSAI